MSLYAEGVKPEQRCSQDREKKGGPLHPGSLLGIKDHIDLYSCFTLQEDIFNEIKSYALLSSRVSASLFISATFSRLKSLAAWIEIIQ